MAERPEEALLIARRAIDLLPGRGDLARRLFATAARLQEEHLTTLGEDQLTELAASYAGVLADQPAARRVQRRWLKNREQNLGADDGRPYLHLARLWFRWLHDRAAAARLCREALQRQPGLTAAAIMLRDELDYQFTDDGWVPMKAAQPQDRHPGPGGIQIGMTAGEVRPLLGPPKRVARQVLFRRYIEQWTYDRPLALCINFNCIKGQEPHVLSVHELGLPRP
jgi:hypothetical protein